MPTGGTGGVTIRIGRASGESDIVRSALKAKIQLRDPGPGPEFINPEHPRRGKNRQELGGSVMQDMPLKMILTSKQVRGNSSLEPVRSVRLKCADPEVTWSKRRVINPESIGRPGHYQGNRYVTDRLVRRQ